MDQLTGRRLGDFVVRHRIGEGGFGEVYRAEQPLLGREAVIKVLRKHHRDAKTLTQRFLREAQLASRLDHPYAAHIYAFGVETDGLMWIAMEYVRGKSLHEVLRTKGRMPIEELVPLLDRICEVLHAAHSIGIVHRDIKPPNVMVVQHSGRAFPKLLDFGIAKLTDHSPAPTSEVAASTLPLEGTLPQLAAPAVAVADPVAHDGKTMSFVGPIGGAFAMLHAEPPPPAPPEPPHSATIPAEVVLTEVGAAMGSPPYMAPEQWTSSELTTARTDLYALGVLAYETLTGRRPFTGTTPLALAMEHASKPVPPLGAGFPVALDTVFAKVLAKDATQRYATALELAAEFRAAAGFGEQPLPGFDEELRVTIESSMPQPIAEAVAAYHGARNLHHGKDALRGIVSTTIRYIALVAVAAHTQIHDGVADPAIGRTLRELRRRAITDEEWLELARELVRPFEARAMAYPIPELVGALNARPEDNPIAACVGERTIGASSLSDVQALLGDVTRMLRALTCLGDYQLVAVDSGRAESWMGLRRANRIAVEVHGRAIEPGQPVLLDRTSKPVLSLWPLVQISAPLVGAAAELFLLDGRGRRGARLVAMPQLLERQDERVWDWLAERFAERSEVGTPSPTEEAPFRGLATFTAADARSFVGREREIDDAVNRLQVSALLAVVGPSGAGKSSFVHAGVVPSLPDAWHVITVRPGATPLAALESRLCKAGIAVDALQPAVMADARALFEQVRDRAGGRTITIVIDQFEELFTLGASPDEQRQYVRALLVASRAPDSPIRVILTLRDDFVARATQLAELRDAFATSLFLLGTPGRAELVRILTEPLARIGFDFDDATLPQLMVDAVENAPGALALLSFTAQKLWELRDRHFRQLTRRAYDALGGVAGALAQHAEATLAALGKHEQQLARVGLGHLVTSEGTRAVLSRDELVQLLDDPSGDAVIEKLIAARLLSATEAESGADSIELVHETLIIAWPRLATWRREDAEGARLRDQVRAAARQWVERGRPSGLLWRDEALAELQVWRVRHPQRLTEIDEAFTATSLHEAVRGRRLRRTIVAAIAGVLVVAVVVLLEANRRTEAERLVAERESAASNRLRLDAQHDLTKQFFQRGREALLAGDAPIALAYLNEAVQRGVNGPGTRMLVAAAKAPLNGQLRVLHHRDKVNAVEWSPDGTRLLSCSFDGTATVWDATTGASLVALVAKAIVYAAHYDRSGAFIVTAAADSMVRLYRADGSLVRELGGGGIAVDAQFRPDAKLVAAGTYDGFWLWDVASGATLVHDDAGSVVQQVAFAPDGSRVIGVGEHAIMYDAITGKRIRALDGHTDSVLSVRFSSDSRYAVTTSVDQTARLWDGHTGAQLAVLRGAGGIVGASAFDPTTHFVITTSRDGVARAYRLPSGEFAFAYEGHTTGVLGASFDPTGRYMATAGADGRAIVWDVLTAAPLGSLQGHTGTIRNVQFSPNGELLATASHDGSVRIWRPVLTPLRQILEHPVDVSDARFSPDGRLVATIGEDRLVRLWDVATGQLQRTLEGHAAIVSAVRFSHDGSWLVTGDRDGGVIVWSNSGQERARVTTGAGVERLALAGEVVAIGDRHGGVTTWTPGAQLVVLDRGHDAKVTGLTFSSDGQRLVAGTFDGKVRVWTGGRPAGSLVVKGRIWEITFAPDDRRFVIAHDGAASIVTADTMIVQRELHHLGIVETARFRADGKQIVTASEDGTAVLWDPDTGVVSSTLRGHANVVFSAEYDPKGQFVVTAGEDRIVRVWDASNGDLLERLVAHSIGVTGARFDASGRTIVTIGWDHRVALWNVELEDTDPVSLDHFVTCHDPWTIAAGVPRTRDLDCK